MLIDSPPRQSQNCTQRTKDNQQKHTPFHASYPLNHIHNKASRFMFFINPPYILSHTCHTCFSTFMLLYNSNTFYLHHLRSPLLPPPKVQLSKYTPITSLDSLSHMTLHSTSQPSCSVVSRTFFAKKNHNNNKQKSTSHQSYKAFI